LFTLTPPTATAGLGIDKQVSEQLETLTVAPELKLVPVSVTVTLVPGAPLVGLMPVNVGSDPPVIVKAIALLVPLDVVTVTLVAPAAALEAMVKVTEI
jgi:hypothetical protein